MTITNIFISLGYNCDPRIFLKEKLEMSKNNGYLSCPFDLCITPSFQTLVNILQSDFCVFFDDIQCIDWGNADGDRSHAGPGNMAISNNCGMIFNHEGGGHSHLFEVGKNNDYYFTENNFARFKERYNKRIENFRNYCRNANSVTFVHCGYPDFCESIIKKIIQEKYNTQNIYFLHIQPDK